MLGKPSTGFTGLLVECSFGCGLVEVKIRAPLEVQDATSGKYGGDADEPQRNVAVR